MAFSFFTADQIARLSGGEVRIDLLTQMTFRSSIKRVWNGNTDLETGGHVWTGLKGAGNIEGLAIDSGTTASAVTLTLSGLPDADPDLLAIALAETDEVDQQPISIAVQLFDADWQPVGAPVGVWWGVMQPPVIARTPMQDGQGGVQSIALPALNAFYNRSRPPNGRYTDSDQQARSPGDQFFQFAPSLVYKNFTYPDY